MVIAQDCHSIETFKRKICLIKRMNDGESIGFDWTTSLSSLNGKIRIVKKRSGKIIGLIISKSRG